MNNNLQELEIPVDMIGNKDSIIKYYIENAERFEKTNDIEVVIKNLEKALLMFEDNDKDNRVFQLNIKLGDMYQIRGDIDKSLKYFESAHNVALLFQDKILQVDALIKITEGYFYKGEIEVSINYADRVEELLKEVDYVKGKLDISLYWLKVYYIRNEYYKAREIGNKALKFCTDEYTIYRGRILNALASLYWELTSVEEHLDLLQQSLKCFEKANYLRGTLGVINNIGAVYAEKLQDNEKALEYFFELKQRSEHSNYAEFQVFSCFNIGELYFKCLRYEEALFWCSEALEKAKSAHMEGVVFHAYVILIDINMRLCNYKGAYNYLNLTNEELKAYPDQGTTLPLYYKVVSSLFLEFGQVDKAKLYIKQALNMLGDEDSIIKWNTGLVYEKIKIREAKNNAEILAALAGIKYILSRYKNPELILDIVYDVTLELMEIGQMKLAFNLVDEYNHIVVEREQVKLKYIFIEAVRNKKDDQEKMLVLNNALGLAAKIKNNKIYWKVCSSLGEYYYTLGDCEKAISYYKDASKEVENILYTVPEEFRAGFMNFHNLLQISNKLIEIRNLK